MSFLEAIALGMLQGVAEFLPISSSGHLALAQLLFGNANLNNKLFFELMLHVGTVVPILIVFRADILELFRKGGWTLWAVVIGTLPAAVLGVLFEESVETMTDSPVALGIGFLCTALVLFFCDREREDRISLAKTRLWIIVVIGLAQGLALMPGISRSGMTIAAALFLGMRRKDAVQFSFFLAIVVILGGAVFKLKDFSQLSGSVEPMPLISGMVVAGLIGYFALKILLVSVQHRKMKFFAVYCLLIGVASLIYGFAGS